MNIKKIDKPLKPIISIRNLVKEFPGRTNTQVLRDLSVEIFFGQLALIYGPSGAGKTTLLNTILGMEVPTSGALEIDGQNVFEQSEEQRTVFRKKKFGIVFQQPIWIKSLNVVENVALPLNISGLSNQRAIERAENLLKMFKISSLATQSPGELSGGEQQKVSVARAMATNPWIIIADEPTGSLDKQSGIDLMEEFKVLNERTNRTIIIVTHNPEYKKYATQLIYVEDGRVVKNELIKKKKKRVNFIKKYAVNGGA